jgi:hypothetical protein
VAIPTVDDLPQPPSPLDPDDVFNNKAYAFVDALGPMVTQINAAIEAINNVYSQDVVEVSTASVALFGANQGQWLQMTFEGAKSALLSLENMSTVSPFAIWHLENAASSGNITFSLEDIDLDPPASGTNVVPPGGVVSVKRTTTGRLKLIGQVVAA